MTGDGWMAWRDGWQAALYGPSGFYRTQLPAGHFRTSIHASSLFAEALVTLARRHDLNEITDIGAGNGELLAQLHALAPELRLTGIELRERPATLPEAVSWETADVTSAEGLTNGLVIANELLDNLACDVVEVGADGSVYVVEVRPETGEERLGPAASEGQLAWLDAWWPLNQPGDRAEVGLARDDLWASVCSRVSNGIALAIDYGHLRDQRPRGGSLASYRHGRQTKISLDGHHDVTAHVAFDSLAAASGGSLQRQAEALAALGVSGRRPDLALATNDPAAYVRALARASQAAELTARGRPGEGSGLGDFFWLIRTGGREANA